jgi:hypothetical protein
LYSCCSSFLPKIEEVPNVKAPADYIGGSYRKSHGNKVVVCTAAQLAEYFDKMIADG